MCGIFSGIIGGILGAIITTLVAWLIANKNRKQNYYSTLIKQFEVHNWNLLSFKLDAGIDIVNVSPEISSVCYQHLNLLFHAWLNRSIIEKDGSLSGWKNWTKRIVDCSKKKNRKQFRTCYREILTHGDLYPKEFITWLDEELEFSARTFHEVAK